MYYEKLALEVGATVAGLEVIKPAFITGESGQGQKFTFVAKDNDQYYAFDVYPDIGQAEILRTYIKKMDTRADAYVVCLSGRPSPEAVEMARSYGIQILGPKEVGDFFSTRITKQMATQRSSRLAV